MTTTAQKTRDVSRDAADIDMGIHLGPASGILEVTEVAVVIPCHNEEAAIFDVVTAFRRVLPRAKIYVFDNASTDATSARAREAGAIVRAHPIPGKGNVVRRMFADVEADVYLMTDGDLTYAPETAPLLIETLLSQHLDMVIGRRESPKEDIAAYRFGHRFGNRLLTGCVARLFGDRTQDLLSGYRVFSRRFVKSFPATSAGFEIETELTVHALELSLPFAEVGTPYRSRPPNSHSKLRTYRDGARILTMILLLFKEQRPFQFFGLLGLGSTLLSWLVAYRVIVDFINTGLVPKFPSAILAASIQLMGIIFFVCGIILDSVSRGRREARRLAYLAQPYLMNTDLDGERVR